MKILFASHFYPPGHPGGTEAYTNGLASMLLRRGHTPFVICAEDVGSGDSWLPRAQDTIHDGIPVRRLSWNWEAAPNPFLTFYDNPGINRYFEDYLREIQPDVVHITSCYSLGAGIIRAIKSAEIPIFLTLTDFWFLCPRHTLIRGDGSLCAGPESALTCSTCQAHDSRLYRNLASLVGRNLAGQAMLELSHHPLLARQRGLRGFVGDAARRLATLRPIFDEVDVPISPSRFLIDMFEQNGYPRGRIYHSPHGLDQSWVSQLRDRAPGAELTYGYIGQIDPLKGVDVLIQAFQLATRDRPARLIVYGDLDKRPDYGARIRRLAENTPSIEFRGSFARPQLGDVLSELDVVVVPSVWYENAPLVIGEAFAAKKPVIATNLGGMAEAVQNNVNGLLVERGDVADLARAIQLLSTNRAVYERLRSAIKPVRTIEAEVLDLEERYEIARSNRRLRVQLLVAQR